MKNPFLSGVIGVVCVSAFAQGTVNFANSGPNLEAKVYDEWGSPLTVTNWLADLYWAPGLVSDSTQLAALYAPASFTSDPTQAGFFFGGTRTIPAAPGSTVTAQVSVWNVREGSSWTEANYNHSVAPTAQSILFQVTLADSTNAPAVMTNLNAHPWQMGFIINVLDYRNIIEIRDAGVRAKQFGFNVVPVWTAASTLVIQATTNLNDPIWVPVQTNNSFVGPFYFSDYEWMNYPARFYRVFSPFL